jgi:hypothetical protein
VVGDHLHGSSFAGTVGTQETEAFPFADIKGNAVNGGKSAEAFGKV